MFTFSRSFVGTLFILFLTPLAIYAGDWIKVHDDKGVLCGNNFDPNDTEGKNGINGKKCGISGMSVLPRKDDRIEFLVVHDAKVVGTRLGIVTIGSKNVGQVNYRPLAWPADAAEPADLEAISSVPGHERQFLVLSSQGQVFPLFISDDHRTVHLGFQVTESKEKVTLKEGFTLPDPDNLRSKWGFEGLSVKRLGTQLVILWSYCGAGPEPGVLYYAFLNLEKREVNQIITERNSCKIRVEYPSPDVSTTRHIADLRIDEDGVVWALSTSDPGPSSKGDIGPFESALHNLGVLQTSKKPDIHFEPTERNRQLQRKFPKRKVEALEFVRGADGGIAFGTDDEDLGGWLYFK